MFVCVSLWIVIKIPRCVYFQFLVRKSDARKLKNNWCWKGNKLLYKSALWILLPHPLLRLLSHAFFFVYACLCVLLYGQFLKILLFFTLFLPRSMHFPQLFTFLRFSRSLPVSFHDIFVVGLFLLTIPPPILLIRNRSRTRKQLPLQGTFVDLTATICSLECDIQYLYMCICVWE